MEANVLFDVEAIGNIIIAVLCIFPMIVNYRYYKKTGIIDYLLVSIYFFSWSIILAFHIIYYGFVTSFIQWGGFVGDFAFIDLIFGKFINLYNLTLDALPLFLVAVRAKYGGSFKNIPNWVKGVGFLTILLALVSLIDQQQTTIGSTDLGLLEAILSINRILLHGFVVYAFITCEWEETPRSRISRRIWIISSAIWVLGLTYANIISFIPGINFFDMIPFAIFIIPIDICFALLLINHIFYPESVLFTHEQIGRALKIYPRIQESFEKHPDRGTKYIKQYLDSIPEDLRLEISAHQ
jgi:hypothetical protein